MARPAIDVVVPFRGTAMQLVTLAGRLATLERGPQDTVTIADNRHDGPAAKVPKGVGIVRVDDRFSSYHARNQAAAAGSNPWLLFIDADVEALPGLLDSYFDPAPFDQTGVLAGGIEDEPAPGTSGPALRYAELKGSMSQERTLDEGVRPYAQTANAAVRRQAFEAVDGFRGDVRSGGDADLCFRLAAAGWELERRDSARVLHRNRVNLPAMLRQRARHGSGAAWVDNEHPGTFPRRRPAGLALWTVRSLASGARAAARSDRDGALVQVIDPIAVWAFELGRLAPNRVR